jgi:ribose transport system ATP-binding protein
MTPTPQLATAEPLLQFRGLSKSFFGIPVLSDVTLPVAPARVLGLVGENGAGKSTLMNVLGGVHPPDAGGMLLLGRPYSPRQARDARAAGIAFVHQELNLFTNLSVAENLFVDAFPRRRLGRLTLPLVDRGAARDATRKLLEQVDLRVPPETPVADLSPGQRQLVEIAKALRFDARLLILDEPTTSLTAPEASRLFEIIRGLRGRGVSVIYISHRLQDVLDLCDDIAVLRDGRLVSHGRRAEYTEARMVTEMVGRDVGQLFGPYAQRGKPAGIPAPAPLLRVVDLSAPPAVRGVSLTLRAGEVLGVAGLMGAGRTELARAIFGLDPIASGAVEIDGRPFTPSPRRSIRRGMAFLTENRREEGLMMDAAVPDNAALAALAEFARTPLKVVSNRRLRRAVTDATTAVRLHAAGLSRQTARTLSGGNQQKVVLAKWLLRRPRIFLLDEPTRGIDVGAKQEVYRLIASLAAEGAGVLMVSSEIEELIGTCDRIMVMARGRVTDEIARPDFDRERILRAALAGASGSASSASSASSAVDFRHHP